MFLTDSSFQLAIEDLVTDKQITYMEAILEFCDDNDIEFEDVAKMMSVNLKAKLKMDAEQAGYMKTTAKLPI